MATTPPTVPYTQSPFLRQRVEDDGRTVLMQNGFSLPPICVFTGSRDDLVPVTVTLYWHHPAWIATVLAGVLLYVLVSIAVRKKAVVTYFVSRAARRRRRSLHAANWLIFLSAAGWIALAVAVDDGRVALLALVSVFASIVFYFLKVRWLVPTRITDDHVWLRGFGGEALAALKAELNPRADALNAATDAR